MMLTVRSAADLSGVDPAKWDALELGPSPFLRYGFLRALELSDSVGADSGWIPRYLLAEQGGRLVGAVPAFVKLHSYGEFIFDWSWAHAAMRAGISYYPKLVIAAPVTPATGRRILLAPECEDRLVTRALVAAVRQLADDIGCSSIHWLFTTEQEQQTLARLGFASRASFQFHWHNRDYQSFEDFLAQLSSRRRKQFRKERRRCGQQVEFVPGADLTGADLKAMDRLYRRNTYLHGGEDYLQPGFFRHLRRLLPDQLLFARVRRGDRVIAGAIYLETEQGLYGRYWGCEEEIEFLHFEVTCYAGIERCIARNIPRFEAGAQGEHKLLRGFEPTPTYSSHWFREPGLDRAVRGSLAAEVREVDMRMRALARYGPYKQTSNAAVGELPGVSAPGC